MYMNIITFVSASVAIEKKKKKITKMTVGEHKIILEK